MSASGRQTWSSLLVVALVGCSLRPHEFEGSASEATSASTTATGTDVAATSTGEPVTGSTTGTTTGASSLITSASDGVVFVASPDLGSGPPGCDPWAPVCPEGQKCMPYSGDGDSSWESWGCFDLVRDPDSVGEACTIFGNGVSGQDSCDQGLMCWNTGEEFPAGTCVAMCTGAPDAPECADPLTTCVISADYGLILCLPMCDPLLPDCGVDEVCIPRWNDSAEFLCTLDASGDDGQVFDPCEGGNACDPGFLCRDPALAVECDLRALGCCLPFCDVTQPNTCPGVGQDCVAWYEPETAPPGFDDVGACRLP